MSFGRKMIGMVVVAQLTLLTRRFVQVEVFGRLKNQLSIPLDATYCSVFCDTNPFATRPGGLY